MKQVLVFLAFVGGLVFFSCQKDNLVSTDNLTDVSVTDRDSNGGHHGHGGGHGGNGGNHNHNDSTHVHDSTHLHQPDSTHVPHHDSTHVHHDTLGTPHPHHKKHH